VESGFVVQETNMNVSTTIKDLIIFVFIFYLLVIDLIKLMKLSIRIKRRRYAYVLKV